MVGRLRVTMTLAWAEVRTGLHLGPHRMALHAAANQRYWSAAGLDGPALADGVAYPLIAANATILAWLEACPTPMIQTRQRLVCHGAVSTPVELVTEGEVVARFASRGRDYVTVRVEVAATGAGADRRVWTSEVDFTPAATLRRPGATTRDSEPVPPASTSGQRRTRSFTISDELIRRYSRRGNYHSDADTASELGLPGLVAQGTQVCGPAYAILLDTWGTSLVERGTFDARFVGLVLGGDTVEAEVDLDADEATFTVFNRSRDRTAAIGRASRATSG